MQIKAPVIFTDSKGDYLSKESSNHKDDSIVWLGDKDSTFDQGLNYLLLRE